MNVKRLLALLLAAMMVFSLVGCGGDDTPASDGGNKDGNEVVEGNEVGDNTDDNPEVEDEGNVKADVVTYDPNDTFTWTDSVSTLASNWNPHTYQTADDSYPQSFITDSLFALIYNDENHPVEGKEAFDGYVVVPAMAEDFPVDVTESVKAEHPEFEIPESATSGYAWSVKLRDDLKWDDGTPITAQTFVDSMQRLLDPRYLNFRAADQTGSYAVVHAQNYAKAGQPVFTSFADAGLTYDDFIAAGHTDDEVAIDIDGFWAITTDDGKTFAYITDDTMIRDPAVEEGQDEDYVSGKYLWDNYLGPNGAYAGTGYDLAYAGYIDYPFEAGYDFSNVGLYVSGDNELTFVFGNALDGFYLNYYAMNMIPLIKPDLYDSCLTETTTASGSVWSSTYCTSVETTPSYGPYIMDGFQRDKSMHFVKNPNWAGWNYEWINYVDPTDGNTYQMYQTTAIDTQAVEEATTRKQMFLAGQLMGYGLQAEDFDQYRTSEFVHSTPAETVFFLVLNGYQQVINDREAAADFDQTTTDLQSMTILDFRKAAAVTFDREDLAATVSPARSGGYALLGNTYIYDPETCAFYRDTDPAMQCICDFYSVDPSGYDSLEEAVDSITGYDAEAAKELYQSAYEQALELGYITDTNNDGISDQTVTITYAISSDSDFMTKTIDYMNEAFNKCTAGTGFDGKVKIVKSAPLGNDWSNQLRAGLVDCCLCGWSGGVLDPFGLADTWTRASSAYDEKWFDPQSVSFTMNIDGKDITLSVRNWAVALNGEMVNVDGVDYNFGYGIADVDTRLNILANIEKTLMGVYDYIPMLQDGGMSLLSQQVYYVVEEYNPMMGRGGMQYAKYNYTDAEWADYVSSQGGTLQY